MLYQCSFRRSLTAVMFGNTVFCKSKKKKIKIEGMKYEDPSCSSVPIIKITKGPTGKGRHVVTQGYQSYG